MVRRPFQIGDGISLSDVNEHSLEAGSPFWIVEDVDLFTTKVVYQRSSERATLNNGALANSRVINSTLSTQAKLIVTLKFPVSVSYEKLQIFHQALDQYFKNRPREWAAFLKFVLLKIEADLGYGMSLGGKLLIRFVLFLNSFDPAQSNMPSSDGIVSLG